SLRASSRSSWVSGSSARPTLTAAALMRCTATVLITSTAGTSAMSRNSSPTSSEPTGAVSSETEADLGLVRTGFLCYSYGVFVAHGGDVVGDGGGLGLGAHGVPLLFLGGLRGHLPGNASGAIPPADRLFRLSGSSRQPRSCPKGCGSGGALRRQHLRVDRLHGCGSLHVRAALRRIDTAE